MLGHNDTNLDYKQLIKKKRERVEPIIYAFQWRNYGQAILRY